MSDGGGRIVVLASGSGSNAQALIDAAAADRLGGGSVVAVVTNRAAAGVSERAKRAGVAVAVVTARSGEPRPDYDTRLGDVVAAHRPDLVVLAGWMRILTQGFLDRFPTINLHPARPGELAGVGAIERAWDEFRAGARTDTGVMVHWVPDERVDAGPVIATADVPIHEGDTLAELEARVHAVEHDLLVAAVARTMTELPEVRRVRDAR